MSPRIIIVLLVWILTFSACAESAHQVQRSRGYIDVPPELERQIDDSVAFADLRAAPERYIGRIVVIAGVILKASKMESRTEIEVLQLPAGAGGFSTADRTSSEGRFLAVREDILDPATVPPGTAVTVIGAVTGSTTRPLDDSEYTYPLLDIKHLTNWSSVDSQRSEGNAAAFYGPSYSPFGFWGRPYGAYPYFGRPAPFFNQPRSQSPPPPPRQSLPPRFRRN